MRKDYHLDDCRPHADMTAEDMRALQATAARYSENDMRALRERLALLETAAQKLLDDADCGGYGKNLSLIYNSNVDALRAALEA